MKTQLDKDSVKLLAEVFAICAEIEGMKVLNIEREADGRAFAYGEEAFLHEASRLHAIARSKL